MRSKKHLEPCDLECIYNTSGECMFGLRKIGCYLDRKVRIEAGRMFERAREINSIEIAKSLAKSVV